WRDSIARAPALCRYSPRHSGARDAMTCLECRPILGRRQLLRLGGIGAAALAAAGLPPGLALAAGGTDALLLNCIDYRLTGATTRYMTGRHMAGKYDQLVLAGASLGAKNDKFPAWGATFWEHVQVAKELHHIKEVIVVDHRD